MIKKRTFKIAALVLSVLLLLTGCSNPLESLGFGDKDVTEAGTYPVTVAGVTIEQQPQKVLVLSPSIADVIIEINYISQLTAASEDCTQSDLETLNKISSEDISAISSIDCDLIIMDTDEELASKLSDVSVPIVQIDPATSREDFERLYGEVGTAMGGEGIGNDQGVKAAKEIFKLLDDISREASSNIVTTACYLYDTQDRAITGDMFGTVLMTYSGLTNVFTSLSNGTYDFTTLKLQNPNIIFCAPGVKEEIESKSEFADLQAVIDGKIYEIDESCFERQGRTVVTCALQMVEKAFPELQDEVSASVTDPTETIDSTVEDNFSSADVTEYSNLQEYDTGDDVLALQERLTELGYLTETYDGTYGSYTVQAVKDFQTANDLEETGTADPTTQRILYSSSAIAKETVQAEGSENFDNSVSQENSNSEQDQS